MIWTPKLPDGPEPLHERLLTALAGDIAAGTLAPGARLPPQRELAHAAGLGLGTVTRAYAAAEQRGLISARVGRGSFVAERAAPQPEGLMDLSRNLPPMGQAEARIGQALAGLQRRPDLARALAYAPRAGEPAHRAAMAAWLARICGLEGVSAEQLVLCGGAQQAMALALGAVCRPGDTVLCEEATYMGLKPLAQAAGYRLLGVPLDAEGMEPNALAEAARSSGARAVYVLPTLQNPTTRTMSRARRQAIADVARRHDLWIVEDDVYGLYAGPERHPPIAASAPDRTWFVASLSKLVAPGLRAGVVVPPDLAGRDRVLLAVEGLLGAGDTFSRMISTQWIEDGTAEAIARDNVAEARARMALAIAVLGPAVERPVAGASLHLWLPLDELEAERVAGRALRAGVQLTPPDAPLVGPGSTRGLRLCLGGVRDRARLEQALRILAGAIAGREHGETARV
ncbi:PLP-dependent aminotransferase family protein [Caulobacter sp. NIBR1757]|uniref:aminotransferase-like domain-containing protein n=1 Tax=Caulobacter sp. NIBR1757 TaxID=3016000 RepID=UPI0022EFFA12|nr:PLP-dependent aminotransferase family protein [Caulobacter sp. NIBR1757]WGM38413.1 Histidinol-phosphate aminotransferase [Caulobacter sp. NIBR1757]